MKAYLRLFREIFSANVAAALEYRLPFLVQLFGMMLNNASFLVFWTVLMGQVGTLGGWGLRDVMFLWALGPASFGLAHIVFGNVRQLGRMVVEGELDVYLLQPKDPLFHVLVSRTDVSAWGDLAYGLVLLPFLTLDPVKWALFLLFTVTGALVFVAFFSLVGALAFWWGAIDGLAGALTEFLLSFTLYPDTVFPKEMRWVFYSVVPAGFLAFLPLKVLRDLDWVWLPVVLGATALLVVAAWAAFGAGLRRYESGNGLGGRV
jgi:ABC-2 type transport system permease protein